MSALRIGPNAHKKAALRRLAMVRLRGRQARCAGLCRGGVATLASP